MIYFKVGLWNQRGDVRMTSEKSIELLVCYDKLLRISKRFFTLVLATD